MRTGSSQLSGFTRLTCWDFLRRSRSPSLRKPGDSHADKWRKREGKSQTSKIRGQTIDCSTLSEEGGTVGRRTLKARHKAKTERTNILGDWESLRALRLHSLHHLSRSRGCPGQIQAEDPFTAALVYRGSSSE